MSLSYSQVIQSAISGFNSIQDTLSSFSGLGVLNSTSALLTPAEMIEKINKLAVIKRTNNTFVNGSLSYNTGNITITPSETVSNNRNIYTVNYSANLEDSYYENATIQGSSTIEVPMLDLNYELRSDNKKSNVTIGYTSNGFTPSTEVTNFSILLKGNASETNMNVLFFSEVINPGFRDTEYYTDSDFDVTPSITFENNIDRIYLKEASLSCSGGSLSAGAGSVNGTNVTLSNTNTSGIEISGSGRVTRSAITHGVSEGYTGSKNETISSVTADSNTAKKYITDFVVPESKTLNSITNNGTVTKILNNNSGEFTLLIKNEENQEEDIFETLGNYITNLEEALDNLGVTTEVYAAIETQNALLDEIYSLL